MTDYQYKLVNGERVALTPQEIAELEARENNPPPIWQPPPDFGLLANQRLDRGIEAGYDAIKEIGDGISARLRQRRVISPEEVEQQLAALTEAVLTMIQAQRSLERPAPPPAARQAASKRGART